MGVGGARIAILRRYFCYRAIVMIFTRCDASGIPASMQTLQLNIILEAGAQLLILLTKADTGIFAAGVCQFFVDYRIHCKVALETEYKCTVCNKSETLAKRENR